MTGLAFLQLDVFADRPGAGNGLAVIVDGQGFDTATMQAIANWTNLSETTFVLPPTAPQASYRVRIFTPKSELPFAGHPSIGTAHAVLESGWAQPIGGQLLQECAAGLLPINIHGEGATRTISVRAPRARELELPADSAPMLEQALANCRLAGVPPALVSNGPTWWCVQLADEACVRAMEPRLSELAVLTRATGAVGLAVFAPGDGNDPMLVVRAFCPSDGIPEDPVTGSANAAIAAHLLRSGALGGLGRRYGVSQGREVGRDGRIEIEIDSDDEVWVGGRTQTVITGTLEWG
jgi:PhzF family phenazine biosynthesis protein